LSWFSAEVIFIVDGRMESGIVLSLWLISLCNEVIGLSSFFVAVIVIWGVFVKGLRGELVLL
jgi:hypothetical protein